MADDTREIVYSSSDVARQLNIKESTLRKYSILLEKSGYTFHKNERGQRGFYDSDLIVFRRMMDLKNGDMSLERSAYTVANWAKNNNESQHDITLERYDKQDIEELKELIEQQNETINKQTEFMQELGKQLKEQQDYINRRMNERDQALLYAIDERMETKKQIAGTTEKQSFWLRLFKRQ